MDVIRVFLVDDHPVVREGLKVLLTSAPGLAVAGEADSTAAAIAWLQTNTTDVALVDLALGAEDAIEALPHLTNTARGAKILVLTGTRDPDRHRAALVAGARGLVLKDKPPEFLLKAIRKVHAGELWFDRVTMESALQRALSSQRRDDAERAKVESLTAREREIIVRVGEGLKSEAIAQKLGISEKTVRNHLSQIFDKLGVTDRLELLLYAYRQKLVKPPQ
ncbi:MAG TPA: response regulator transcription factor [Myxococcaceae bacterium]|jgi:DNA-binding NarL/FixJ family response regulator|nr:response regulator transcription factor [Myxococcaceae bacterium]